MFTQADLIETQKVIQSHGEETVATMRDILLANGKSASGELIQSLAFRITYEGSDINVEFSMVDYGQFVDKGRKPGKQPPISAILPWLQIRGIPETAAFPIARKIGLTGIKPTPFFESTITNGQEEFATKIAEAFAKDYEDYITKQFS